MTSETQLTIEHPTPLLRPLDRQDPERPGNRTLFC